MKGKAKNLVDIIADLNCSVVGNIENIEIKRLDCDSREVKGGSLFFCVSGTDSDGHDYAESAVKKGSVAIICERRLDNINVPQIIVKNTRLAMAAVAVEFYDHPAEKMRVIGITGTNGKTTTTYMLKAIFEAIGKKVGIIGTICTMIGDKKLPSDRTTPDSIHLQDLFYEMNENGVDIVIMEVSSHALDQNRVAGILFDVAEFTNITVDHLDYHHTFENYFNAKKKLFDMCVNGTVNIDDEHGRELLSECTCPITTFGLDSRADMFAKNIEYATTHTDFTLCKGKDEIRIRVPIPGKFTVYNALGAASVAQLCGVEFEDICKGLSEMHGVPGRIESLPTYGRNIAVYLDYAHTPDALENIIKSVREIGAHHRIVTLFGCGGDRDSSKRATMGEIAGRLSDFLVVTSDNPRTEDPMSIIDMILPGVKKTDCPYVVIENRLDAIKFALLNAQENDIIILAGKGHEDYQQINGEKHHFDEKEIVDELLRS